MGRIFEKRKHKMFARFAKMSKAFNRIGKEIQIAIRLGGNGDPKTNPRLRIAIQNGRALNMPKDRIDAAIKRATDKDTSAYQEIIYEGYAPHGIAVIVECATDNPTRTVSNIRHIFQKNGGSLATSGAVDFMFERVGVFSIEPEPTKNFDDLELELIDFGAEDILKQDDDILVYTSFHDFGLMQKKLEENNIKVKNAELQRMPTTSIEITPEQESEVNKLFEELEEDDDVQAVFNTMK